MTFPARVEDGPAGLGLEGDRYPGIEGKVIYGEGVLVGYRFYETTRLAPLFPFGFGLSYGDFVLEDVKVGGGGDKEDDVQVEVTVVNNGTRRAPRSSRCTCVRPSPSSAVPTASSSGSPRSPWTPAGARPCACRWGPTPSATGTSRPTRWRTDPGRYELLVGTSSRDIWASTEVMWGDFATG